MLDCVPRRLAEGTLKGWRVECDGVSDRILYEVRGDRDAKGHATNLNKSSSIWVQNLWPRNGPITKVQTELDGSVRNRS